MIVLENESIRASFSPKGAELQQLKDKLTNLSYIWDGDPAFWPKHSPVLFPIVGALKQGGYEYGGKSYTLPRHGFARDHEFEVNQISNREVLFILSQSAETLLVYPFEFKLRIRYKIEGAILICTYEVFNPGSGELLFSIGGHPAFTVPLEESVKYGDYYLEFNADTNLVYHKIKKDLITIETMAISLENNKLPLKHELFYEDALVFKTLKSDCISIKNTKNARGLDFRFKDFSFFGIWAAKNANFVCLEPWCGIADGVDHDLQLKNKEGIQRLAEGETWQRSWSVAIF